MIVIASSREAKKAAIELARKQKESAEERLRSVTAELLTLKSTIARCNGIASGFLSYAESQGLDLRTVSADGKYGPIDTFVDEETEKAHSRYQAGFQDCFAKFDQILRLDEILEDPFQAQVQA